MYCEQQVVVGIGTGYDSGTDLLKILKDSHIRVDADTYTILSEVHFRTCYRTCTKQKDVTLMGLTPRMLGQTGVILKAVFFNRVERSGYFTVHPDAGIFFSKNHFNPKQKGSIFIGMDGLRHPQNGKHYILAVKATEGKLPFIHSVPMEYDTPVGIDDTFVFGVRTRR